MATTRKPASSTSTRRSGAMPVSKRNHDMSVRHLKESVAFNKAHEVDHKKARVEDTKRLKKVLKAKSKASSSQSSGGARRSSS